MYLANLIILWENIFSKYVIEVNENIQIIIPHQTCTGLSTPMSASSKYVGKTSKNFLLPLAIYVLKTLRKKWCLMFNNSAWIVIS